MRNAFAAAVPPEHAPSFAETIDKAGRSSRPPVTTRTVLRLEHNGLYIPGAVVDTDKQMQDDLMAVFYKVTRGLFWFTYGREMTPVMHRTGLLTPKGGEIMTRLLLDTGGRVERQGAEFEWLHVAVEGELDTGIWLYKVLNAAIVYVGTGKAADEEMPFARGLIVGGLPGSS